MRRLDGDKYECGTHTAAGPTGSCNVQENCKWKPEEEKCDVGDAIGFGFLGIMIAQGGRCSQAATDATSCAKVKDCAWKEEENKCDVDPFALMMHCINGGSSDGSNMCKDSADMKSNAVVLDGTPCSGVNAWLTMKLSKPWSTTTCDEMAGASWVEDDGSMVSVSQIMSVAGPTCCGDAAKVRSDETDRASSAAEAPAPTGDVIR